MIGPDDPIVYPPCSHDMNFEPEVAVVIGRIAKNVPVERAMDYVLGFTCVNDVTLRDLQQGDPMWTRAKGFDTTLLPGDVILTGTPDASGNLVPGDEAVVHVEGIGDLRNIVVRG